MVEAVASAVLRTGVFSLDADVQVVGDVLDHLIASTVGVEVPAVAKDQENNGEEQGIDLRVIAHGPVHLDGVRHASSGTISSTS